MRSRVFIYTFSLSRIKKNDRIFLDNLWGIRQNMSINKVAYIYAFKRTHKIKHTCNRTNIMKWNKKKMTNNKLILEEITKIHNCYPVYFLRFFFVSISIIHSLCACVCVCVYACVSEWVRACLSVLHYP